MLGPMMLLPYSMGTWRFSMASTYLWPDDINSDWEGNYCRDFIERACSQHVLRCKVGLLFLPAFSVSRFPRG